MTTDEFEISLADPSADESLALVHAMEEEIEALYVDRWGSIHSVGASPDEMTPPNGAFVVVWIGERQVGCGGLKRLDSSACELKRMFLTPEVRGRGLSTRLLSVLEARARDLGYSKARLDTGDRQQAAQRLYEGAGYLEIEKYNDNNLATLWYEKDL